MSKRRTLGERIDRMERMLVIVSKKVLSIPEAATYLDRSEKTLRNSLDDIPHYKRNGRIYFRKDELDDWLCGETEEENDEED